MSLAGGDALRGLGYLGPVGDAPFVRLDGDTRSADSAPVATEVPVALVYNRRPHAVMLATPRDLEDFAIGFSLAEGIVSDRAAVESLDVVRSAAGVELHLTIPAAEAERLEHRNRRLAGRTGCGLCGVEQIADALRLPEQPVRSPLRVTADALWAAAAALEERQPWNRATHALHAAGFATVGGDVVAVREDVGRHNALDKLLGALAREGRPAGEGFVVVTSRASVELVQKSATAGVPLLAAVSRPTALAIRVAEAAGIALVGLLRGRSANLYSHAERVLSSG